MLVDAAISTSTSERIRVIKNLFILIFSNLSSRLYILDAKIIKILQSLAKFMGILVFLAAVLGKNLIHPSNLQ